MLPTCKISKAAKLTSSLPTKSSRVNDPTVGACAFGDPQHTYTSMSDKTSVTNLMRELTDAYS